MVCTWLYVSIATHPLCNKLHLGARHLEEYHTSLSAGTSIVCMLCLPTMHTNCDPVQVLLHCIGHLGAKTLLESCVCSLEYRHLHPLCVYHTLPCTPTAGQPDRPMPHLIQ